VDKKTQILEALDKFNSSLPEAKKVYSFTSRFFHKEPMKYSNAEAHRWYLYLCEIQLWLRLMYDIHVDITVSCSKPFRIYFITMNDERNLNLKRHYNSYPHALEAGIVLGLEILSTKNPQEFVTF